MINNILICIYKLNIFKNKYYLYIRIIYILIIIWIMKVLIVNFVQPVVVVIKVNQIVINKQIY